MEKREILLADRDTRMRTEVAKYFEEEGYRVETTDSAVHAFCSVLEKRIPVVILANDFDRRISTADLIHLLKRCNRRLAVILVSDELPVSAVRRIRREGIFYHALTPSAPGETGEIREAVERALAPGASGGEGETEEDARRSPIH